MPLSVFIIFNSSLKPIINYYPAPDIKRHAMFGIDPRAAGPERPSFKIYSEPIPSQLLCRKTIQHMGADEVLVVGFGAVGVVCEFNVALLSLEANNTSYNGG